MIGLIGAAHAFDGTTADPLLPYWSDETIVEAFREGTRAYYAGDKVGALDELRSAAEGGHPAAQWKLGRMYSDGDGVVADPRKALEYFNRLIETHGEDAPTSPQAPFVANAFVEIGTLYMSGSPEAGIEQDPARARQLYTYAASYFGDALAQVSLGRMYLDGVGVERDPRQAARWFLLAARKGQLEAQIRLGELLTSGADIEANPVHGLMWLTVALERVQQAGSDDTLVRAAHEAAFALAGEDVRRRAAHLAGDWIADNPAILADAAQ